MLPNFYEKSITCMTEPDALHMDTTIYKNLLTTT